MASLSNIFIKNSDDLKANRSNVVIGPKYRFTILSERLIRLEYNEQGIFEDRATERVVFRNFRKSTFYVTESETILQIKTRYFTLTYMKNKPFLGKKMSPSSNLKVVLNESDKEWYYGHPEVRNFGGNNYSLDNFNGKLGVSNGLYSTDGFVSIDDSNSKVLSANDEYIERENKEIDIYLFMYRKDLGLCFKDYFTLTGYPSLIPRYALGNWWYRNEDYNLEDIKTLVAKFDSNNIPLSVFLLGDKWHDKNNNFMLDNNKIDASLLKNYLNHRHINFGLTINPEIGISETDNYYEEIRKYINVDKGKINLLPLNMTKLGIYFKLYINKLEEAGVNVFHIDYNNPNDVNNLWLLSHYHYANSIKNRRGLIVSRNTGIAPHRYPILFSGKTTVSWETLNIIPFYNATASNMGISWWAHAIGGFYGGVEDDELYLRYVQLGVFSPIFMLASDSGKYYKREPWRWYLSLNKIVSDYMRLRHRLIPYIYNEAYNYHINGSPLIQPLYYKYPQIYDEPLYRNQYYFGNQMLIAPITKGKNTVMNRVVQKVFIPKGTWYDFISGKKFPGNNYYMNFYKDEDYPVFCSAGSIIPLSNDLGTEVPENLELQIFPGKSNTYKLYEDDGISNNYKRNDYIVTFIQYDYQKDNYTLLIRREAGKLDAIIKKRNYKVRFRNTKMANVVARSNDKLIETKSYVDNNDFIVELNNVSTISNILLKVSGQDIEIKSERLMNEEIGSVIDDLEISTNLKEKIDSIIFGDLSIKKKRIAIRKLKKDKLEPKFINLFIKLLEYIEQV